MIQPLDKSLISQGCQSGSIGQSGPGGQEGPSSGQSGHFGHFGRVDQSGHFRQPFAKYTISGRYHDFSVWALIRAGAVVCLPPPLMSKS